MTTQLIALLASAGLVTAGVASTAQTRSAAAIPVASMVSASKNHVAPGLSVAHQSGRPDCSISENKSLPECSNPGGGGGGASGYVLGAGGVSLLGLGVYVAAKNDSNG